MAENSILGLNRTFPIYVDVDGTKTAFHDLVVKKATMESVVMSLGDKISGDVYYKDNSLTFTMQEYVEYDGVKYYLVNPPTIVREGWVKDNSGLNGMTKYSLVFYHPMYMLGNFPFTDKAVTEDEEEYLSQNKTFSWIGNLFDFVGKLNTNLEGTQWLVVTNFDSSASSSSSSDNGTLAELQKAMKMSDVLSFDKQFISDALKTAYDTWEIPFVIDQISDASQYSGNPFYDANKKFVIAFGLPTQEIYASEYARLQQDPYVFQFGQGVGLKNNSRTPKNNKIVTRIVPNGTERNIPYGYPQIVWEGDEDWEYTYETSGVKEITIDGETVLAQSYPIYDGIVGGQKVRLIKHPFTRTTLMPSIYSESVNKKVNPYATGYDPRTQIIDYIDADNSYPNPINTSAPSVEIHQFEDVYPRLNENDQILDAYPIDTQSSSGKVVLTPSITTFVGNSNTAGTLYYAKANSSIEKEKDAIQELIDALLYRNSGGVVIPYYANVDYGAYTYKISIQPMTVTNPNHWLVNYTSGTFNVVDQVVAEESASSTIDWDDTMDDNGEYVQSYFKIKLPRLTFDLYACASITEEMQINMRSGACHGCTFNVQVDWEDYKKNFYNAEGEFDPEEHSQQGDGHVRDITKYPDSSQGEIEVIVQKDLNTFGTLMPNKYQYPKGDDDTTPDVNEGDKFVILGISLPLSYITNAEAELTSTAEEYMLENNVYYYEYPLKFDEYFLVKHQYILSQIRNNNVVRFLYEGSPMALYIKQITIKYGESPLPQYDITLTDDVEIVLNKIGQVTDDVSRMRVELSELQKYYSENIYSLINEKLSKVSDDISNGRITFQQGLEALASVVLDKEIRSTNFNQGLYTGNGWRIDELGNAELESLRVRSYLEIVELLINRMQAQEGDTLFSDNDQIEKCEPVTRILQGGTELGYILSFKEKYDGYFTAQKRGNILKGIINTLAASEAKVSTIEAPTSSSSDEGQGKDGGDNYYYTSWMRVTVERGGDIAIQTESGSETRTMGNNQVYVVLYSDADVPSGKNFAPCELMNVARWGCIDANSLYPSPTAAQIADVKHRQSFFAISTTDGRITKYIGVSQPKLDYTNYGTTLGELPDFVRNWSIGSRLIDGRDYLYAQGIVVGDFIKVDIQGRPQTNYVDCGEWIDGSQVQSPTYGHGKYLHEAYNPTNLQYETHDVWHNGCKWRCLQTQPVNGVYYEPTWGSSYWTMIEGDASYTLEFASSRGYAFRQGFVNTTIQPHLFKGNIEITPIVSSSSSSSSSSDDPQWSSLAPVENWAWKRYTEATWGTEPAQGTPDYIWNEEHKGIVMHDIKLVLTNADMPSDWSSSNKAIFNCIVTVVDGENTIVVENQVISQ